MLSEQENMNQQRGESQIGEKYEFVVYHREKERPSEEAIDCFVDGLAREMDGHEVANYFQVKRYMFDQSHYVVTAFANKNEPAGVLMAKWYTTSEGVEFLNLETLLIGDRHQRWSLAPFLLARLFGQVMQEGHQFPDYIAMKTYTPRSYNVMNVFSRNGFEGVEMYPSIEKPTQNERLAELAATMAECLSPGLLFDKSCGAIRGGGGEIADKFWPAYPSTRLDAINKYFRKNLHPEDRMLCVINVPTKEAKAGICRLLQISIDEKN
jgi:hypothetical protein